MNYGEALEHVKKGGTVRRPGWPRNTFVYLNPGSRDISAEKSRGFMRIAAALNIEALFENGDKGTVTRLPNLNMRAKDGSTVTGWTPSQIDQLAEDWEIADV